jgi:putative membrane protein
MKHAALPALLLGLMITLPLQAQSEPADADRSFLEKAAQANLAEIETGKLAATKATTDDLRKFGQKMVQDHSKTLKQLQGLAQNKGVTLPSAPDDAHKALAADLSRASGKEFDLIYVKNAGVADHEMAKTLFEAGTGSQDADIRSFAKKVLPDIEHHLEMAQKISADVSRRAGQ